MCWVETRQEARKWGRLGLSRPKIICTAGNPSRMPASIPAPGNKLTSWWNPLRFLWRPLLAQLERFALDLWGQEIADWLPEPMPADRLRKDQLFGGLYQKMVIAR